MGIFRGGLYGFKPTKWIFYCYKKNNLCESRTKFSATPRNHKKSFQNFLWLYATVTILRCFSLNQNWTNIFITMQQNCIWRTALLLKLKVQTRVHTEHRLSEGLAQGLKYTITPSTHTHTHTLTPRVDALQFTRQALYKPVGFRIVQYKHSEATFGKALHATVGWTFTARHRVTQLYTNDCTQQKLCLKQHKIYM